MPEIKGSYVAIITPFNEDLSVDFDGLGKLLDFHMEKGTHGIVPCGTTGESATMSHETHREVIKFVVDHVKKNAGKFGRKAGEDLLVMAGTGSNSTSEAIELTKYAESVGADACLVISPYYNKPTQEGLKKHFGMIADAVDIPIVMYNVPGRTGRNMEAKTSIELGLKYDNIVGIKEASGNIEQMMKIIQKTRNSGFSVMSGDDALTLPLIAAGGKGIISVAANIVPDKLVEMVNALLEGDFKKGRDIHYQLLDLFTVQFIETNPGPVKYMAARVGLPAGPMRPPMVLPTEKSREAIDAVLKDLGLI